MSEPNPYCKALGIAVPRLEAAKESRDANYYALLIVALLERGEPITLEQAARRFDEAGVAPFDFALASLKRCKPGRPPIYRDGDLYALDPHDHETDLWAFRLGLRPPKGPALRVIRPNKGPLPSPDDPLTVAHLDEAWRQGSLWSWSAQRIAICVLDANPAPMEPEKVVAFVEARGGRTLLTAESAKYWRRGAPIRVLEDGQWSLDRQHKAVLPARRAVHDCITMSRRWSEVRTDPAVIEANQRRYERERDTHAAALSRMRRVILHSFPAARPEVMVLLDVGHREITTYHMDQIPGGVARLNDYDYILAVNVRGLLRGVGFDPGDRRLGELGTPQKTMQLNRQGRTLRITLDLLARGCCGISQPFGDEKVLLGYLRRGEIIKLRRRVEADVKSLFALYQYGLLHGAVRVRWGFLDEMIPAPWVHRDEQVLYQLMERPYEGHRPLEVVIGSAPGWNDPWARARPAFVVKEEGGWRSQLVDEHGYPIDADDVQLARLAGQAEEGG